LENPVSGQKAKKPVVEFTKDIIERIATRTRTGFIPQTRKVNQDNYIIIKDFAEIPKLWMFGVMDGHG
jgi:serine/threonine protein phosphatase PrpC